MIGCNLSELKYRPNQSDKRLMFFFVYCDFILRDWFGVSLYFHIPELYRSDPVFPIASSSIFCSFLSSLLHGLKELAKAYKTIIGNGNSPRTNSTKLPRILNLKFGLPST